MTHLELHQNFPNLTSKDIDVYFVISDSIYEGGKNCTSISAAELEKITGITERTIRKSIHAIVGAGLLIKGREGRKPTYSLPDDDYQPPRRRKGGKKRPEKNDGHGISDNIKDIHIHTNTSSDISDTPSEHDIFAAPVIRQLPPEKIEDVRKVYMQLRHWKGSQALMIGHSTKGGKIAYMPTVIRQKMQDLTSEQLSRIIRRYDPARIQHKTAWVQTALMHPWESEPYGTMSDTKAVRAPRGHFQVERQYDIACIEAELLGKPVRQARAM